MVRGAATGPGTRCRPGTLKFFPRPQPYTLAGSLGPAVLPALRLPAGLHSVGGEYESDKPTFAKIVDLGFQAEGSC